MNKKVKVFSFAVACSLLIGALINTGSLDSVLNFTSAVSCLDGNHVGYHYSKVDPTTEHNGTKEYWVCCKCHEHYLVQQDGAWTNATPTDAYLASLVAGDDRYLPSLKEVTWANQDITIGMDPNGTADTKVNAGVLEATGWWIRLLTNDFHIPTGATAITFAMKSSKNITDMSYVVRYSGKSATTGTKTIGTEFESWTIPLAYNDVDLTELEFLVEGGTLTIDNVEFVVPIPSFTFDGDEVEVTGGTKTDNGVSVLADTGWNPSATAQLSFEDLDVSEVTKITITALITGTMGDDFKVGLIGLDGLGNPIYNGTWKNGVITEATSVKNVLTPGEVGTFDIDVTNFDSFNGLSFASCGHNSSFELRSVTSSGKVLGPSFKFNGDDVEVTGGTKTDNGVALVVGNDWHAPDTPALTFEDLDVSDVTTITITALVTGGIHPDGLFVGLIGEDSVGNPVYNGTHSGTSIVDATNIKDVLTPGEVGTFDIDVTNYDVFNGFSFGGRGYTPTFEIRSIVSSGKVLGPCIHVGDETYDVTAYAGVARAAVDGSLELTGAWWVKSTVDNIPVPSGTTKVNLVVKGNQTINGIYTYIGDQSSGSMKWLCTESTAVFNVTTEYTTISLDVDTTNVEYITELRFCVQDNGSASWKVLTIQSLSFTDPSF